MKLYQECERELRERRQGWWDRLTKLIPELKSLAATPQPPEHHAEGDVSIHTRMAIEACPQDCDSDLPWVALLHDIGKPKTTVKHADGRITAHGHARAGAELAENILERLEMPTKRCRRIVWTIQHHMFHHSWQLESADDLSNRHRAYLTNPDFPLLLEFLRVDTLASHGQNDGSRAYLFYRGLWTELTSISDKVTE